MMTVNNIFGLFLYWQGGAFHMKDVCIRRNAVYAELQIMCVKLTSIDANSIISWPNPMFDLLLESSRWDDSNKRSNIGFSQGTGILGLKYAPYLELCICNVGILNSPPPWCRAAWVPLFASGGSPRAPRGGPSEPGTSPAAPSPCQPGQSSLKHTDRHTKH